MFPNGEERGGGEGENLLLCLVYFSILLAQVLYNGVGRVAAAIHIIYINKAFYKHRLKSWKIIHEPHECRFL